jgi:hypothetical protein
MLIDNSVLGLQVAEVRDATRTKTQHSATASFEVRQKNFTGIALNIEINGFDVTNKQMHNACGFRHYLRHKVVIYDALH